MYSDLINLLKQENIFDSNLTLISNLYNSCCENSNTEVLDFVKVKESICKLTGNPHLRTINALWFCSRKKLYFIQIGFDNMMENIDNSLRVLSYLTACKLSQTFAVFFESRNLDKIQPIILIGGTAQHRFFIRTINWSASRIRLRNPDKYILPTRNYSCEEFEGVVERDRGLTAI